MSADRNRVYVARVIVTSLYCSLQGKFLVQGDCKEFVLQLTGTVYGAREILTEFLWQLTGTEFMVQGEL